MTDAFTDIRRGFDLVVGNPPWAKIKLLDDDFFSKYDPAIRSLSTKTEKIKRIEDLLKNPEIKQAYKEYKDYTCAKSRFYKIYELQGSGDKDLWQIMLERALSLLSEGGLVSMVIPSPLLSNKGGDIMRKQLLTKYNIKSLYVFENRKKIFPIMSTYRFALLTIQNEPPADKFPAGFYLHNLSSLEDNTERKKFGIITKQNILDLFPHDFIIPEIVGKSWNILTKLVNHKILDEGLDGWDVSFSSGLHKTNDAHLLKKNKKNDEKHWSVLEGKYIHQFLHDYARPEFVTNSTKGLEVESKKSIFAKQHREFYESYRIIFRDIARSTDTRTIISTIIPPHKFHTNSLYNIVLTYSGLIAIKIIQKKIYNKKISYLVGILNSMTFDFLVRTRIQLHTPIIIRVTQIPNTSDLDDEIIELATKLSIGDDEFAEFAESLSVKNTKFSPEQRIEATARLDALVAHAYGLTRDEYDTVIESFDLEDDERPMFDDGYRINWSEDSTTMRRFFGKVAAKALDYYDKIAREREK